MAAVAELSFLLFALTNNIHAEELITIRKESDSYTFEPPKEANFCLISTFEQLCKGDANNLTVQWFQLDFGYKNDMWTNVFGSSTTSLMYNEKRTFEVMKNTSALVVSDYKFTASSVYTCLVMNKTQFVSSYSVKTEIRPEIFYYPVGERAVLNCSDLSDDQPPVWKKYNAKDFFYYKAKSTVLGQNDSLVFPSLTLNDSGVYTCEHPFKMEMHLLGVCPNIDPPAVAFFSEGEEVTLRCNQTGDFEIIWLMKSNKTEGRTVNVNLQKPDEGSRIKISYPNMSLVLSNVSLEDTGEYWCAAVDQDFQCVSTSKIVLVHREPCGICSIVYTVRCSLLSGLLLTLCVAVVTVTRRTRRGEQFTAV